MEAVIELLDILRKVMSHLSHNVTLLSKHTDDLFKKRQRECSQLEGHSPFTGRKIITEMVSNILFISLYFGDAFYPAVCI